MGRIYQGTLEITDPIPADGMVITKITRDRDGKDLSLGFNGVFPYTWTETAAGFVAPAGSVLAGTIAKRTGIVVYNGLGTYATATTTDYTQPFWNVNTPLVYKQISNSGPGTGDNLGILFNIKQAEAARISFGVGQDYYGNVNPQAIHTVTIVPKYGTNDYLVTGSTGTFISAHADKVVLKQGEKVEAFAADGGGRWIKVDIYRDTSDIISYRYRAGSGVTPQWSCRPMKIETFK